LKRCFAKEEKEVYGFFRKIMATGYCKIEIFENRMIKIEMYVQWEGVLEFCNTLSGQIKGGHQVI